MAKIKAQMLNPLLPVGGVPDVYQITSGTTSTITNITVTKKPRYIVLGVSSVNNTGMLATIDVKNSKAYRMGYWSNANQYSSNWTGYTAYVKSITNTNVQVCNAFSSSSHKMYVAIYY